MSRSRRRHNAFSLLELILVVAMLSIGIIAVMQAFSFSARLAGFSADTTRAVFLAQDKFQEWEFIEKRGNISLQPKESKDVVGKFGWQCSITPVSDLALQKLDVILLWQRGKNEEKLNFSTYLMS